MTRRKTVFIYASLPIIAYVLAVIIWAIIGIGVYSTPSPYYYHHPYYNTYYRNLNGISDIRNNNLGNLGIKANENNSESNEVKNNAHNKLKK